MSTIQAVTACVIVAIIMAGLVAIFLIHRRFPYKSEYVRYLESPPVPDTWTYETETSKVVEPGEGRNEPA